MIKRRMNREQLKAHKAKMKAIGIDKSSPHYYQDIAKRQPIVDLPIIDNPPYRFGEPAELNFNHPASGKE